MPETATREIAIPNLGVVRAADGFVPLERTSDGMFRMGIGGVESVTATGDGKVEFVAFDGHALAHVKSAMDYPAYYPVRPVALRKPIKAVLMDLDGTSVRSETFWIWIIQQSTASLLGDPGFELEEADLPFVSGHSVSEHLQHCIGKYCPDRDVEEARTYYFEHARRELREIMQGRGRQGAFVPTPGLKEFLYELKGMGIQIGLVTSGLYEKAWPEILSAFRTLGMGDPGEFYDAIITAGIAMQKGRGAGTLGELSPKPHPWLYAEAARMGLGLTFADRHQVLGIEDSGAGIVSVRLAGFSAVGFGGGNIDASGTRGLCEHYCETFEDVLEVIKQGSGT